MSSNDEIVYRCVERMFTAVDIQISSGRFISAYESLDEIEDLINEIRVKLPLHKHVKVNSIIKNSINYIKSRNFITIEINNKLNTIKC